MDDGCSVFNDAGFLTARSTWVRAIYLWLVIKVFCWALGACLREVRRIFKMRCGELRLNGRKCLSYWDTVS